jgi:hypothetical protein
MLDKHEDRYSSLLCTLYFLDGNNFFAIFGLFIIGQLRILAEFKSSFHDVATAHKAIIHRYGEMKVCYFNVQPFLVIHIWKDY